VVVVPRVEETKVHLEEEDLDSREEEEDKGEAEGEEAEGEDGGEGEAGFGQKEWEDEENTRKFRPEEEQIVFLFQRQAGCEIPYPVQAQSGLPQGLLLHVQVQQDGSSLPVLSHSA
jgi:hypothetical protein